MLLSLGVVALASTGYFSSLAHATFDNCPPAFPCCVTPHHSSLTRRTDTCPVGAAQCCERTEKLVELSSTKTLQCGRDGVRKSEVSVKLEKCHNSDEKCIHVSYANVRDTTYKEVHLAIDDEMIAQSSPGRFLFNSYCSIAVDAKTADCWVPLSKIITDIFGGNPESFDLCDKKLWIATHAAISDGNTCWGVGTPIPGKSQNWAMTFDVSFKCSYPCAKSCCCPPPPPPTQKKMCGFGTAFGYNPVCAADGKDGCHYTLNSRGCQRWGWYHEVSDEQVRKTYTVNLYVGASHNDITGRSPVGTATIFKDATSGKILIKYELLSGFDIKEAHVYINCVPFPEGRCAPGQYNVKSGCLVGPNNQVWTSEWTGTCSKYFVIFHAAVTKIVDAADPCAAVDCTYVPPIE